jgi:histidinol-phosphate aminotransferase
MKTSLKPWINDLPDYVAGRTIEEIKRKYGLASVYKLASNENLFGPSGKVKETLKECIDSVNYYPDSDTYEIRTALAGKFNISKDNIIMGDGTDQVIEMICDCFIDRQDNIVTGDPNFLIYEKSALISGGSVKKVPLRPDFSQDIKSILNTADSNTKAIFIASPHNPSGTIISKEDFEYLLRSTGRNVLIVMDEAYYEYMPPQKQFDTVSYISGNPNLIVLRTFSKIYGLAGLRIGYGIADPEIITGLNKIRLPFNVSSVAQKAAIAALADRDYILKIRDTISNGKDKFYSAFKEAGIEYVESFANFILVKTGEKSGAIVEEFLKNGFIVRPGVNLGLPGYIRVTLATPEIDEKFLMVFIEIYKQYYSV